MITHNGIIVLLVACAGLGVAGAWLIAGIPFQEHLLDNPNERSSHIEPTPRGGGVGILAAFLAAGFALRIPYTFLFAAVFVSAVSFYGDYFQLSVKFRLLAQVLSALVFLFPTLSTLGAHSAAFAVGFSPFIPLLVLLLSVVYIVGTANFYNFMDGINGIAGVSGAISFGLLGAYTLYYAPLHGYQEQLSLLAVCIALACLGYLPFNLPRARVFLGDVGSILLGFVFAALVLTLARNFREIACFAALLFPFYADELTTMAVRIQNHENILQPHRRHLYQLLANEVGMAHWKVTLIYGAIQLVVGGGVLFLNAYGARPIVLFLAASIIIFALISLLVRSQIWGKSGHSGSSHIIGTI